MRTLTALFRRRPAIRPLDHADVVQRLQADLANAQRDNVGLTIQLRWETHRADQAEAALNEYRAGTRDAHAELVNLVDQKNRENAQLRKDRDGALEQLDRALGYDDKVLATINAGGISKAAAA